MPDEPPLPDASPLLSWTDEGEPRSGRFGDVYFSRGDGLAESQAVFLDGCGLPEAWTGRPDFTVGELGFGTGLNIIALIDLWRRAGSPGGRLNIFSIEAYPLSRTEAARALSAWPGIAETAAALLARWPAGTPGFHRIDLPEFDVVLDLAIGDAAWALDQWRGRADAWFLDGFSPALNPGMWSEAVLDGVAARSAPGARLATFTVAGAVRRGLAERGFTVEKRPGHGRKRERLEARFADDDSRAPAPARPSVLVIGAGVAGAATARALTALGAAVTVIEADRPGAGGSGFPAGLVTPRLDAGDALIAGLNAQALERAVDLYRAVPDAVVAEGVAQLEQAPRDAVRFAKVADQPIWPEGSMAATPGRLTMNGAATVRPAAILEAWLEGATRVAGTVAVLETAGGQWRALDPAGTCLAEGDAVVLAAGWGLAALRPELGLAPVRGQAEWVRAAPRPATAWGGYLAPTDEGFLFGATHDRGDVAVDVRDSDSARNLETLRARLPDAAEAAEAGPRGRRAAIRATTPDRLPLCGPLDAPGLYVLGGLGSRGFCLAPLLGEHLAAVICDAPSPLPRAYAERLDPGRGR